MTQQRSLQESTIEKAEARIGLDSRHQMAWFVRLANTPAFGTMTDGEHLLWQEEFVAMWIRGNLSVLGVSRDTKRYPRPHPRPPATPAEMQALGVFYPPAPAQMQEVRDVIAGHINGLADEKGTRIGGIQVSLTIDFYPNPAYDQNKKLPRYLIYRGEVGEPVYNIYQQTLLLRAAKLFETYADKIRRCALCQKIFVQLKRSAKYCGPKCYTVGCMREFRATKRMAREQGKQPGHKAQTIRSSKTTPKKDGGLKPLTGRVKGKSDTRKGTEA